MAELIVDCSHSCAPTSDVVHASVFSLAAVENISAWKKKKPNIFSSRFFWDVLKHASSSFSC